MKKLLILFLLLIFAIPVYSEELPKLPKPEPERASTKPIREYYTQLYNSYMAKVEKGEIDCNDTTYTKYVMYPTVVYMEEFIKAEKANSNN